MPSLTLEDFDLTLAEPSRTLPATLPVGSAAGAAPDPMATYEDGYQAGWDDAVNAQSEDRKRIDAEFARNLEELSFTFHEARSHVIQSMEPLLREIVDTLLPGVMAETFALTLQEELRPMIDDAADTPIELMVGPGGAEILADTIADFGGAAIKVTEEESLADGQAYFRIGKVERQIDLSGALDKMRAAISALFELNERTLNHA